MGAKILNLLLTHRGAQAGVLFVFSSGLLATGVFSFGVTWDEPAGYFIGAFRFLAWLKEPLQIAEYWPVLTQDQVLVNSFYYHPPLTRILGALTWSVFHFFFDTVPALRMAAVFLLSGTGVLLFYFVSKHAPAWVGLAAALFLWTMPRVLAHGYTLSTDVTLLFFWVLASFVFFEFRTARRGAIWVGITFGLLILTKFTGLLWGAPVFLYDLFRERKIRLKFWITVVAVGLVVSLCLNPTWWRNPWDGFVNSHILLSLSRNKLTPFSTYYLGQVGMAPWHYVPVLILITTPILVLIFFVVGVWRIRIEAQAKGLGLFCLFQILVPFLLFCSPTSPKYDGVRLYLVLFPWMAVVAALGLQGAAALFQRLKSIWAVGPLFLILMVRVVQVHPMEYAYYNGLVGGAPGALKQGFETTFFWDAVNPEFCEVLNQNLPPEATVQVYPDNPNHFSFLQYIGALRKDVTFSSESGDYFLLMARQGVFYPWVWKIYNEAQPVFTLNYEGVPLILVYKRS